MQEGYSLACKRRPNCANGPWVCQPHKAILAYRSGQTAGVSERGEACSRDTAAQNKVELGECIVRVVVARLSVADDVLDNEARALRAELRCMNDLTGPAPTNQYAASDCRQEPTVA
jgi:hypothetical protein